MESLKARASCPSHNVVFLTIVVYDINLMNYNDIKGKITSTKGYKVFYEELYECLKFSRIDIPYHLLLEFEGQNFLRPFMLLDGTQKCCCT
jgi:hypothetical protein